MKPGLPSGMTLGPIPRWKILTASAVRLSIKEPMPQASKISAAFDRVGLQGQLEEFAGHFVLLPLLGQGPQA